MTVGLHRNPDGMDKIKPPTELKLTGNVEDQWRRFKQRFTLYLQATGEQARGNGEKKVALLLTIAGADAIDVFNSFQLTTEQQKDFALVVGRFDAFCTPKRNETFERYVFNSRIQTETESVEEFIMDLKLKSQSCNFGELAGSLMRDRIVMGVRDKHLREKLLGETDLTLEKAVQVCQARELTRTRMKTMDCTVNRSNAGEAMSDVDRVAVVRTTAPKQRGGEKQAQTCTQCGGKHMPRQCPAYGRECYVCGMKNHYSRVCRQKGQPKQVHRIEEDDGGSDTSEELFVGSVELTGEGNEWTATYSANGADIAFKLDTGAQVNIIPETALPRLVVRPDINELKKVKLRSYSGENIPTLGTCTLVLDIAGKPKEVPFVVVRGNRLPIIGLKTCISLGLVKRVHSVTNADRGVDTDRGAQVEEAYADVFQGMGKLKAQYRIELEEPNRPVIHAQIEKEALALAYACKKFHVYIYGKRVWAETDHKPLVTIAKKGLAYTPPRVQRLFLNIQKYDLQLDYRPGKELLVADTLSRAFDNSETSSELDEMVHVNLIRKNCSVSDEMWTVIARATAEDATLQKVMQAITRGWSVPAPYSQYVDELSVVDGILFKGSKIVVPQTLQDNMLVRIHEGHLGMEKSKRRAKAVLYWPNMGADIERSIGACETCQTYWAKQSKEPLWVEESEPLAPWSKVGIDLFTLNEKNDVLVLDYYSHYPEIALLRDTTASQVILQIKSILARHGIPSVVRSDNGPQFNCAEFRLFAQQYGFKHVTSSPNYPQSNGLVENGVKIVKLLIKKAILSKSDPYLALLTYRSTPLKHGLSPADMLFHRKLRTTMPDLLETTMGENDKHIQEGKQRDKNTHKRFYDKGARELTKLNTDDRVRMHNGKSWNQEARVLKKVAHRSYEVRTPEGVTYRRNRRHLLRVPERVIERQTHTQPVTTIPEPAEEPAQLKRSGRVIRSPQRWIKEM